MSLKEKMMQAENQLNPSSDIEIWEGIKFNVFQTLTIWELIMSKIQTQQPDNMHKQVYRLFEEVETILEMFQIVITECCVVSMNGHAPKDVKNIHPDKNICKYLGISQHSSKIYLNEKVSSSTLGPTLGQPSEMALAKVTTGNDRLSTAPSSLKCKAPLILPSDQLSGAVEKNDIGNYLKIKIEEESDCLKSEVENLTHIEEFHNTEVHSYSDEEDQKEEVETMKPLTRKSPPELSRSAMSKSQIERQYQKNPEDLQRYCTPDHRNYKPEYPIDEEVYNQMKRGEIPKQCPDCKHYFTLMHSLIKHLKSRRGCEVIVKAPKYLEFQTEDPETGKKRYGCTFKGCHEKTQKLWKSIYGVHMHYSIKHKEFVKLDAKCSLCDQAFLTSVVLKMHVKSAHNQSSQQPDGRNMEPHVDPALEKYCKPITRRGQTGILWYNPEYPISHEDYDKMVQGEIPKQCPICRTYFTKVINMIKHWKAKMSCEAKIHLNQPVSELSGVVEWEEGFPIDKETWQKMKKGEIKRECPICKKTLQRMQTVFRHFRRKKCVWQDQPLPEMSISFPDKETGKIKYLCAFVNCPDYGKIWGKKYGVQKHWEEKHADSLNASVSCSHCPKKFITSAMLKTHIRCEHPESLGLTFTCSLCGKTLKNAQSLRCHEATHQSKLFACEFCDFKTGKEFSRTQHIRRMHPEKIGYDRQLFKCEECWKSFKWEQSLKEHMQIAHTDYVPDPKFKCPICSKQLKQSNSFDKHMINAHRVGEKCEICSKLFKTKDALEQHKKKVHDD